MKLFKRRRTPATASAEASVESADEGIVGERGAPSIVRTASLQSRISNLLAIGLLSVIGIGLLTWYYSRALEKSGQAREAAHSLARERAQGEVTLPPLGPIESVLGPPPMEPPPDDIPDAWLQPAQDPPSVAPYAPPTPSPEELVLARRLSGPVVAPASNTSASANPESAPVQTTPSAIGADERPTATGTMATLLAPSVLPAAHARVLPTQRLLLPKGAFVDCTLETAIDSTLPGMVTCVTATDTFGVDGSVVLLERGTKLLGETRGQVQQGAARVFVLWSEARTPTGVVIPLVSPGTDELGRSGLPGEVNRHFWERFGAAILISVIDGAIQREVQSAGNGGTVIYNPSTTQNVMTEVLKSTVNIPPTVTKHNGDRIHVLVARDLDFRSVYELRPAAGR